MFQVNPLPSESSARQRIHLKHQALFSSKDKSKKVKKINVVCCNFCVAHKGLRCVVHLFVILMFTKGNNFCDFLFTSLKGEALPRKGYTLIVMNLLL